MNNIEKKQVNVHLLWLGLMLLTLTTYALGKLGFSGVWVMLFLILTVTVKAMIIMRDFMQLRNVSKLWKKMMYGWLAFVCLGISLSYLIAK